ncbi:histidine phosphatase superfamily [Geopyxis carbonaria]|nr:histidine phosphatase superfamily [Geopyxis carbonaria]
MGKPRLIILVRHAESEGNCKRSVHQTVPDHRVPITAHGRLQALDAGARLAALLEPSDTLQIITSPYMRTRETTQGILSAPALAAHPAASTIKVTEEPRLREQDFGNFQPCTAEMHRMLHERNAYGHFFFRIPSGESASDAYNRVAGFNDSLWRQFAKPSFPSVLVLVTHGLMTRVFLMKWFHYSVETFENLRNVDHCQFITMARGPADTDKYVLQTQLGTWDHAPPRDEEGLYSCPPRIPVTVVEQDRSRLEPPWDTMLYGGCVNGCNHPRIVGAARKGKGSVIEAGRDFGGSRSGCASPVQSDDEGSERGEVGRVGGEGGVRIEVDEGAVREAGVHRVQFEQAAMTNGCGNCTKTHRCCEPSDLGENLKQLQLEHEAGDAASPA